MAPRNPLNDIYNQHGVVSVKTSDSQELEKPVVVKWMSVEHFGASLLFFLPSSCAARSSAPRHPRAQCQLILSVSGAHDFDLVPPTPHLNKHTPLDSTALRISNYTCRFWQRHACAGESDELMGS